ncbi:MAG: hypothetical protein L0287_16745 [Anaerolineae bacterium]|nr:hypothetical protein [Anaerolineae bacterium]
MSKKSQKDDESKIPPLSRSISIGINGPCVIAEFNPIDNEFVGFESIGDNPLIEFGYSVPNGFDEMLGNDIVVRGRDEVVWRPIHFKDIEELAHPALLLIVGEYKDKLRRKASKQK